MGGRIGKNWKPEDRRLGLEDHHRCSVVTQRVGPSAHSRCHSRGARQRRRNGKTPASKEGRCHSAQTRVASPLLMTALIFSKEARNLDVYINSPN